MPERAQAAAAAPSPSVLERGGSGEGMGTRMGQRIQLSSSGMTRFIGQVLDASRLQTSGSLQMTITDVDVARVLEDVLDESRTAYPGVTIVHDVPGSLGMPADADRLAQLFSDLISNAGLHGIPGEPVAASLTNAKAPSSWRCAIALSPLIGGLTARRR